MNRDHQPIIDWLKVVGMVLILLGHLVGKYTNDLSPPIYPKQLGVAFFLFAAGYSLARERRSRRHGREIGGLPVAARHRAESVEGGPGGRVVARAIQLVEEVELRRGRCP